MFAHREIQPREVDFELMWLWFFPALVAAAWTHSAWQGFIGYTCPLKSIAGIPCMLCGGTRAAYALSHGHFPYALEMNPLATIGMIGALGYLAYAALCVAFKPRRRIRFVGFGELTARRRRFAISLGAAILIANWAYLIVVGR